MNIRKREASYSGRSIRKNNRSGYAANAGIIAYMILLGMRIPLSRMIGDAGLALLAPAFELYMLAALSFGYGISRTMTGLIRYRVKRGQFRNAGKVFHTALRLSLLLGLALALAMAALSGFLSETVFLEAMSGRAILAAAPTVILTALIGVFRGFFNGSGYGPLVAYSQYIEKTAMLIAGIAGGRLYYGYGRKVAALLKNDMPAYADGALGVIMGILIAELITLLYLSAAYALSSGSWKRQQMQDSGRRTESGGEITGMLLGNGLPMTLVVLFTNSFMMIDQRFFNYCMNRREMGEARTAMWGSYYGKYAVLTGIGAAFVCLAAQGSISKTAPSYEREEYRMMRERIGTAVKKACVTAFPAAVMLAVLSENLVTGLYTGDSGQAVSALRQGAVVIFFYGMAYVFCQLMLKMRMVKELLFCLAVSFAVHLLAIILFVQKGLLGADGIVYAVILFTGVLAVLGFILVSRRVGYKQEWIGSFAFPAASAAVSGLAVMLLNRLLFPLAGAVPALLVCVLAGTALYMALIVLLHVMNAEELSEMPFGGIWSLFGRLFGAF
ncbi:MAG: polysaccharide biosynthesis C-terminal domain-containing protein [Blautia sp.]|nr:polysaccharide biosynthesis C-terminal domain-containing protein [Blautia sp.]MCM1200480.1 polysaccharide biosynthesis C-terminal domain-containing protein [Bacteroides fragilis]